MAAINGCTVLRSSAEGPPVTALRSCILHPKHSKLGFIFSISPFKRHLLSYANVRNYCLQSLLDTITQELQSTRKQGRIQASNKLELSSYAEHLEDKIESYQLQKGLLIEFKKDSKSAVLAVIQKPDGKENWMVSDQNGVTTSIKPQQITFIVPGVTNFNHTYIAEFAQKAKNNLDPTLLEFAWIEVLEKKKSVTVTELAEMIFGSAEPLDCYCAYLLLSKDDNYFTVLETNGHSSVYGPRSAAQVEEIVQGKLVKEANGKEFHKFIELLKSAKELPLNAKPPKSSWRSQEKVWLRIESLEAFSIDACKNDNQKRIARMILKAMGLERKAISALNLLIKIGYFPVHVNLDLLKFNIRTDHPDEVLSAAETVLSESSNINKVDRANLTHLKVYAIDVDEADELDDALSATRLQDGRIKVWIHVADPTSFVKPWSILDKEAMKRGTSVFLPTATYPMFPKKLAMEGMSFKQGKICNAVTVSVILHFDGSIAEYEVTNSIIKPTYMLTYESASELLDLNLEEEYELKLLSEAARIRLQWRKEQGAIDTATIESRIKVSNPDDYEAVIKIYIEDQRESAMRLVCEMMILCGEAIASYGCDNKIPLPYRGQPQSDIDSSVFSHLQEGPVRSYAMVRIMRAAEIDFRKPIRHGILGIPGYVQFTSPIRRYMDLLAHYQVKAYLKGDTLPFSAGEMEIMSSMVNMKMKVARNISNTSLRYWILEYLRRQPKGKRFCALVLRFINDRNAAVLLTQVGLQASAWVSLGIHVGDEVELQVVEAHPRHHLLSLKEICN